MTTPFTNKKNLTQKISNTIKIFGKALIVVSIMTFVPTAITFGMFGLAYLVEEVKSVLLTTSPRPFSLDIPTLFVGVFTGTGVSFIWCMFIFEKAKMFKKEKEEKGVRKEV